MWIRSSWKERVRGHRARLLVASCRNRMAAYRALNAPAVSLALSICSCKAAERQRKNPRGDVSERPSPRGATGLFLRTRCGCVTAAKVITFRVYFVSWYRWGIRTTDLLIHNLNGASSKAIVYQAVLTVLPPMLLTKRVFTFSYRDTTRQ